MTSVESVTSLTVIGITPAQGPALSRFADGMSADTSIADVLFGWIVRVAVMADRLP